MPLSELLSAEVIERHMRVASRLLDGATVELLDEPGEIDPARQVRIAAGSERAVLSVERLPDAADRDVSTVLGDLAAGIEAEVQLALMRSRLDRHAVAEEQDRQLETRLGEVARAATRAEGVAATVRALAMHGAGAVEAAVVSLATMANDTVRFFHGPEMASEIAEAWAEVPSDTAIPVALALTSGEPVIAASREELESWPLIANEVESLGLGSFVAIPIIDDDLHLRAAVGIGFDHELDVREVREVPRSVRWLISLTADALRSAYRYEREHRHGKILEQLVLPSALLRHPAVSIAGAYLSPSSSQRVGGDVYDVVPLSGGRLGLLIADAVGHDLDATRTAARLRHAVGALAHQVTSAGEVLTQANQYVMSAGHKRHVTASFSMVDPAGSTITTATAGHPAPLLKRGSDISAIGPVGEPLLGLSDYRYSEETTRLEEGDSILAFTDGLVERRSRAFADGETDLKDSLRADPSLGSWPIVGALVASTMADNPNDDVAAVALTLDRRNRVLTYATSQIRMVWPADSLELAEARRHLRQWLTASGASELADTAELVTTELLTNARAAAPAGSAIEYVCQTNSSGIEIRVEDEGPPFSPTTEMPTGERPGRRGLPIVASVSHSFDVERRGRRNRTTARVVRDTFAVTLNR